MDTFSCCDFFSLRMSTLGTFIIALKKFKTLKYYCYSNSKD